MMLKRFFSIFLLITMSINIFLPMIERVCDGNLYELLCFETDDSDEKGKSKESKEGKETKEKEEKNLYSKNNTLHIKSCLSIFYNDNQAFFSYNKLFASEKFVTTPKQPPKV
jgi:hypothetical protein